MNTFGFSTQQWNEAKKQGIEILAARAKIRGMMPYSELVKNLTAVRLEAHDVRLDHLLAEISADEDAAGHGMLSVIVVHKVPLHFLKSCTIHLHNRLIALSLIRGIERRY